MIKQWGKEGILGGSKRSSILELLDFKKQQDIQEKGVEKQMQRQYALGLRVRSTEVRMRIIEAKGKER